MDAVRELAESFATEYGEVIDSPAVRRYFDGDALFIPTCLVAFIFGVFAATSCWKPSRKAAPQRPAVSAVAAPVVPPGPRLNTTRAAMKRAAKLAGKKLRTRPKDIDELKMVLVLRKDLKLPAGTAADLCASAAIQAVELCASTEDDNSDEGRALWSSYLRWWNEEGVAKVTLRADGIEDLRRVVQGCAEGGLPCVILADSVIAVGPAPVDDIDDICGEFKLF